MMTMSAQTSRYLTTHARELYDVVVCGSGMVGATLVALLGARDVTRSLKVALVDPKGPPGRYHPPEHPDLRVSTLTPSSINTLKDAGVWGAVAPPHSAAFTRMQVWDASGGGHLSWSSADVGLPTMGVVVENNALINALMHRIQEHNTHTHTFMPGRVRALTLPPASGPGSDELASVELEDGTTLTTRLVIGADGAGSRIRDLAGLRVSAHDYQQRAVVATVVTEEHHSTAWQRFLPSGPVALLPVRDGYSNIVWSTTPDAARQLEKLTPAQFARAVNLALRSDGPANWGTPFPFLSASHTDFHRPPLVNAWVGQRPASFPLRKQHSDRYTRSRLALVGDAAHVVHPLAGQGVNLGLGDVCVLARAMAGVVETGGDVGHALFLESQYESPRSSANSRMSSALHTLHALFSPHVLPVPLAVNAGMTALNRMGSVKNNIMKFAMGVQ